MIFVCSPQANFFFFNSFFHSFSRFFRPGKLSALCEHDVKPQIFFRPRRNFRPKLWRLTKATLDFCHLQTPPPHPSIPTFFFLPKTRFLDVSPKAKKNFFRLRRNFPYVCLVFCTENKKLHHNLTSEPPKEQNFFAFGEISPMFV